MYPELLMFYLFSFDLMIFCFFNFEICWFYDILIFVFADYICQYTVHIGSKAKT